MGKVKYFNQFLNRLVIRVLRLVEWLLSLLPLSVVRAITEGLMFVAYPFLGRNRRLCEDNLRLAFGETKSDADIKRMTKTCIKHIGRTMIEMMYYDAIHDPDRFRQHVAVEGLGHLKDALAHGKGVIGVTGHLGNFPMMFMVLVRMGYKVNVIIRPMRNAEFGGYMDDLTKYWGVNMIKTEPPREFLKATLRALKDNEILFILLDEDNPEKGDVEVSFLNRQAKIAAGPQFFHDRTGALILPMFMPSDRPGHHRMMVDRPLSLASTGDPQKDAEANIRALMARVEGVVLQYPTQWGGWMNKKWSRATRPATPKPGLRTETP